MGLAARPPKQHKMHIGSLFHLQPKTRKHPVAGQGVFGEMRTNTKAPHGVFVPQNQDPDYNRECPFNPDSWPFL